MLAISVCSRRPRRRLSTDAHEFLDDGRSDTDHEGDEEESHKGQREGE